MSSKKLVHPLLHEPTGSGEYESLHTAMALKGFARIVNGDNGKWYKLQQAHYIIDTVSSFDEVRMLAIQAVRSIGRKDGQFSIFVSGEPFYWFGLEEIPAPLTTLLGGLNLHAFPSLMQQQPSGLEALSILADLYNKR